MSEYLPTADRLPPRGRRVSSRPDLRWVATHDIREWPRGPGHQTDARTISGRSAATAGTTGTEVSAPQNATRAIQGGRAPYVGLLHDDDRWDRDFLSRRVSFLESHKTCGLVFSNCNYIGGAGEVVYGYTPNLHEGLQPRRTFLRTLYRQNVIATPTVLTRRSVTTPWDRTSVNLCGSTTGKCGYGLQFASTSASWTCTTRTTVSTLLKPRMKPSVGWANIGSSSSTRWTVGFRQ